MPLEQKRWILLVISIFICFAAGSIYAWSVFSAQLAVKLTEISGQTVTPADLASVFALANGIGPIPMILGGAVTDRFGPRAVIMAGGALIGAGLFFSGSAESISSLLFTYGILFGIGLGLTYGCVINNTLKFFPDHRGLAAGLMTAVYGGCSVVLPPVARAISASAGISHALELIGLVFGAVIVAGGFFSMKCPAGFMQKTGAGSRPASRRDYDWKKMMTSPLFWCMAAILLCGAVPGMMILSQAFSIAVHEMQLAGGAAAAAVSAIAGANVAARFASGPLSDKTGRLVTLSCGFVSEIIGLLLLSLVSPDTVWMFYAGLMMVGLAFGTLMAVYPGYTADEFGTSHNAVNYGIMFCGFSVAGIAGPSLMKTVTAAGYGFSGSCLAAAAFTLIGLILIPVAKKLSK